MKKRPKLCLAMKLPVVLEHDTVARYKGITALAKPNILLLLLSPQKIFVYKHPVTILGTNYSSPR